MLSFGPLAFGAPWVLLAVVALPLLVWLMRAMPPAPRRLAFPAVGLLFGLRAEEQVSVRTPWWLILLRLLLALVLILGLAGPVLSPDGGTAADGDGPLVLVVDDTWAAAPTWSERRALMLDLVARAGRHGRAVMVLTTAAEAPDAVTDPPAPMAPGDAATALRALDPKPWNKDLTAALDRFASAQAEAGRAVWVHDGLAAPDTDAMMTALGDLGGLTIHRAGPDEAPLILRPVTTPGESGPALEVTRPAADRLPARAVTVRALDAQGRAVLSVPATLPEGATTNPVSLDLPAELLPDLGRVEIAGHQGAAAVVLADGRWRRRPVGLVVGTGAGAGAPVPLLDETHYLRQALVPLARPREGGVTDLLQGGLALMLMTDGAHPDAEAVAALVDWVRDGGTLVRFAGPRLPELAPELLPVRLRPGERAMGGALSWTAPARLASFPDTGPFAGLTPPDDVTVSRQVLAEPAPDLPARTWARLEDGTPLVTGATVGRGRVVLVHVTADPRWSSLAMSGLFIDMLRRLIDTSAGVGGGDAGTEAGAPLPPYRILDGFGRSIDPPPGTRPLPPAMIETPRIDPAHPPGLYGHPGHLQAHTLGAALSAPQMLGALPEGAYAAGLDATADERDLRPPLLTAALVLALVDLLVSLAFRGLLPRPTARATTAAAVLLAVGGMALAGPAPARADDAPVDPKALAGALHTRLAWVDTGEAETDRVTEAGLTALTRVLARRTSAELAEPVAVDPARDALEVFPLLYWAITPGQPPVTSSARRAIAAYLRGGGMILMDVHPGGDPARVLDGVDIPPLEPMPQDHVLTRSFYLLDRFPGRTQGQTVWVEADPSTHDGVSSLVVGAHDWAAAWATDETGRALFATVPGGNRQREMAYRFGVNLVLYALTGNYKGDQDHLPAIMERLTN